MSRDHLLGRIDPTDAAPVQLPLAHEFDDIPVRYDRRLMHLLVVGQQLLTPTFVADEYTKSCPLTSSRLNNASSSVA
jgi:hypothetical protein